MSKEIPLVVKSIVEELRIKILLLATSTKSPIVETKSHDKYEATKANSVKYLKKFGTME